MKPEAQRIAIAEACGWKHIHWNGGDSIPFGDNPKGNKSYRAYDTLHDYLNDLNAAVDFVTHLTTMGWRCQLNNGLDTAWECEFFRPIQSSTHHDNIGKIDGEKMEVHYGAGDTLAIAICESGLRALGKWVEV